MEALEEPPLQNDAGEAVKVNVVGCESNSGAEAKASEQLDVCHKPNGIGDSETSEPFHPSDNDNGIPDELQPADIVAEVEISSANITDQVTTSTEIVETEAVLDKVMEEVPSSEIETIEVEYIKPDVLEAELNEETIQGDVEVDGIVDTVSENVRFETEILVETNSDDQPTYKIIYSDNDETDHANDILNELGQNIELSEVLRSSDVNETVENNNCGVRQEVFNKEELLDILEGNDVEESTNVISDEFTSGSKKLEAQLALQQLSRLKQIRKSRHTPKKPDRKSSKKSDSPKEESIKKRSSVPKDGRKVDDRKKSDENKKDKKTDDKKVNETKKEDDKKGGDSKKGGDTKKLDNNKKVENSKKVDDISQTNNDSVPKSKEENIVKALFKDWDDEEPSEGDHSQKIIEGSETLLEESEALVKSQEATIDESHTSNADVSIVTEQTPNLSKSGSESQPQRRLGRVIKKKVIFDPDNPDTFTKSKVIKKENLSEKDNKDQPTPKRIKTDPLSPRSKSKSPVQSKMQWKKPQPKNIKQNKRLTEIDRLLMDEGAVNMICQLTPEAPKGHKNMKSKAEFIKKIQSSTPEGKEMKFRERKKELKYEEGDPRRIGRLSLSSSVKSPAVSEDFEAHSADDSIIYRRHSSSSYSSPCMSPRRLSDVESINQGALALAAAAEKQSRNQEEVLVTSGSDVFMSDITASLASGVINKNDFLSIKEKLNSKLSKALNKRKRDNVKMEKPLKIKKPKPAEKPTVEVDSKFVKLAINQKVAEICIQNTGSIFNVEVMNDLRTLLESVECNNDISVTLLTSEFKTLCSGLDLKPLLDQAQTSNYAQLLAESVRSLLLTLESHSKLVCTAVEDRCLGLGVSLVALSDITVASEKATFELSSHKNAPLQPGAAALTSRGIPQSLLNEMILFERPVSAVEALEAGFVSRTVWPERVVEQARAIAKDIAAQPAENIVLKKQLLRLKRGAPDSFLAAIDKERDLFVKYWTSAEGRKLMLESA